LIGVSIEVGGSLAGNAAAGCLQGDSEESAGELASEVVVTVSGAHVGGTVLNIRHACWYPVGIPSVSQQG